MTDEAKRIIRLLRCTRNCMYASDARKYCGSSICQKDGIERDAAAQIERDQAELANYQQLKKALQDKGFSSLEAVFAALEQVKRERDAAVKSLEYYSACRDCQYYNKSEPCDIVENIPFGGKCGDWKWRGLCAGNGGVST